MGCLTGEGRHDGNNDLPAARVLAKLSLLPDEFPSLRSAAAVLQKQQDIHKRFGTPEFCNRVSSFVEAFRESAKGNKAAVCWNQQKSPHLNTVFAAIGLST